MRKKNFAIVRLAGLLLLLLFVIRTQGQFNEKTGFTKYAVDSITKATDTFSLPSIQGGRCSINADTSAVAGTVYTYTLNCKADYWSVIGGVAINVSTRQITIQWSTGYARGAVRAYSDSTGLLATKNVNIGTIALLRSAVSYDSESISYNGVHQNVNSSTSLLHVQDNWSSNYTAQSPSSEDNVQFTDIITADGRDETGASGVSEYLDMATYSQEEMEHVETYVTVVMVPPLVGGCITSADQIILFGNLPATINATAASGGTCSPNYTYQWQSSTDNIYFYDIPGATSQNLSFSTPLAQTTWFQRRTICGIEVKYTNSSQVTMTSTIYYNVQKSGTFTRNNCASGYTGSSVTYTVNAGVYASAVSQADADQKAQNDVNANGQTYANNNGVCNGPVTITLTNAFVGTTYPASIKVEFLQGGNVMQTNYFPSGKTASTNITLASGTYQMRFTMPSGFSTYYVSYDKNNPYQYWDNGGSGLTLTTGSVTFVTGTAYTVTASNSIQ